MEHYTGKLNVRGNFAGEKIQWIQKLFRWRKKKKICHQYLSMKVQLEPVLKEDHELLWSLEIVSRICCSILKMLPFSSVAAHYTNKPRRTNGLTQQGGSLLLFSKRCTTVQQNNSRSQTSILSSSFLLCFLATSFGRSTFSDINCTCRGIFLNNRAKQMDIQRIILRKSIRGRRSNYYVDLSRMAIEGESLVQL